MVGRVQLDHARGFSFFAVMKVLEQKHAGEKVFWEAGGRGGPGVTIGLDKDDAMVFRVRDVAGRVSATPGVPREKFFDERFHVVFCGLEHRPGGPSRVFIELDRKLMAEAEAGGDWGGKSDVPSSIGCTLEGGSPAAFQLAEVAIFASSPNDSERDALFAYAREKYEEYEL